MTSNPLTITIIDENIGTTKLAVRYYDIFADGKRLGQISKWNDGGMYRAFLTPEKTPSEHYNLDEALNRFSQYVSLHAAA